MGVLDPLVRLVILIAAVALAFWLARPRASTERDGRSRSWWPSSLSC
jgi:hypothetical protein